MCSKKYSQRAMQIQSPANLLQQSSFNQQRDRSRCKSSRRTQEVSVEEIDQAKDQGKHTKKTGMKWDKKESRTIKDDK